jgi:hypothetical protein
MATRAVGAGDSSTGDCLLPPAPRWPSSSCSKTAFIPRILPRRSQKPSKSDAQSMSFNAEPTDAQSMSFMGTHEYLALEIICDEGHDSVVDWWTL